MNIERTTTANVKTVRELPPDGFVIVDEYNPVSSVTPWDYHGGKHQREFCTVIRAAGIECVALRTVRTLLHPRGTGPGGSVRFGDNMTPGTYEIAVPETSAELAREAIERHRAHVREWLDGKRPMPDVCR